MKILIYKLSEFQDGAKVKKIGQIIKKTTSKF